MSFILNIQFILFTEALFLRGMHVVTALYAWRGLWIVGYSESGLHWCSGNVLNQLEPKTSLAEVELNLASVADDAHGTVNDVRKRHAKHRRSFLDGIAF